MVVNQTLGLHQLPVRNKAHTAFLKQTYWPLIYFRRGRNKRSIFWIRINIYNILKKMYKDFPQNLSLQKECIMCQHHNTEPLGFFQLYTYLVRIIHAWEGSRLELHKFANIAQVYPSHLWPCTTHQNTHVNTPCILDYGHK